MTINNMDAMWGKVNCQLGPSISSKYSLLLHSAATNIATIIIIILLIIILVVIVIIMLPPIPNIYPFSNTATFLFLVY